MDFLPLYKRQTWTIRQEAAGKGAGRRLNGCYPAVWFQNLSVKRQPVKHEMLVAAGSCHAGSTEMALNWVHA